MTAPVWASYGPVRLSQSESLRRPGRGTVHGQVLSDLRRYQDFGQPCSDEVAHIEALLAGMPAEQCITGAEKRRRARQEEKRRWEERSQERERQRAGDVPRRAQSEDRDILWEILSGTMTKYRRGARAKTHVRQILRNAWPEQVTRRKAGWDG